MPYVVATQRRFRAHFGARWAPCKQTIYRLSLGTIFQLMRISSVPDIKWFCKNKNVLCVQSMVWHFVRHSVFRILQMTDTCTLSVYSTALQNTSLRSWAILKLKQTCWMAAVNLLFGMWGRPNVSNSIPYDARKTCSISIRIKQVDILCNFVKIQNCCHLFESTKKQDLRYLEVNWENFTQGF